MHAEASALQIADAALSSLQLIFCDEGRNNPWGSAEQRQEVPPVRTLCKKAWAQTWDAPKRYINKKTKLVKVQTTRLLLVSLEKIGL